MKHSKGIPYYARGGVSLGFRSMAAAKRLIANGAVKPSYGRKGHLRAIWLGPDGLSSPSGSTTQSRALFCVPEARATL